MSSVLKYAFVDMVKEIGPEILLGLILAALVGAITPVGILIRQYLAVCCTSSNALKVVQNIDAKKIIFIPEGNDKICQRVKDQENLVFFLLLEVEEEG